MHFSRPVSVARRTLAAFALLAAVALLPGCSNTPTRPIVMVKPLSRVVITPALDSLLVGGTRLFTAVAYDTSGHAATGAAIAWRSADPAVARVNSNGLVTALGEGLGRIVASAGNKADTATVYVTGTATGWVIQTSGATQNLNALFFQPDGRRGYAVGDAGTLVVTSDAGATWAPATSGTTAALHSIWFTSSLVGWAAGSGGKLMKTVDGGTSWAAQTNIAAAAYDLMCVRFSDADHGWIVGSGGLIARTRDGGATWTKTIPFAYELNSVAFTDSLDGWLAGGNGTVMGTHDGGASWYPVTLGVASQTFKGLARASATVAIAVGTQGTVARSAATADSLAWSVSSTGAGNALEAVFMANASAGWAVGSNSNGLILATSDGGASWTPQAAGISQTLSAVFFVDPLRGWAAGAGGRILHTTHGGNP